MKSLIIATLFSGSLAMAHSHFVVEPENCLKNKIKPCAVKNISYSMQVLPFSQVEISMHPQSALQVQDDGAFELITGEWLLTVHNSVTFKTLIADIFMSHGILLVRIDSEVSIDVLDGDAELLPRGQQQKILMPQGYHWAINGITTRGIASVSIPQASLYKTVITRWAKLNARNKHDFYDKAEMYKQSLVPVIEQSAALNQQLVTKLVEDDQRRKAEALRQKQRIERENGELRQLFRRKIDLQ